VPGGCTAINGMIYLRGPGCRLTTTGGNAGWGWDDVLPYFRRSEDGFRGTSALHGAGGEWVAARQRLRWDILEAFRDAAEEIGAWAPPPSRAWTISATAQKAGNSQPPTLVAEEEPGRTVRGVDRAEQDRQQRRRAGRRS
jgi:choline dehydrogenase-like flavoprotein